jgi:ArsR family transcriptional regulator, arsenate/arsenite/antimonite-responsive transcriptional repressor
MLQLTEHPSRTTRIDVDTPSPTDGAGVLEVLDVLADPHRRQILQRLADGAVCTCTDLVTATGVRQPTVSHHLKVLREAGLVRGERCGRFVEYTVVADRLRALAEVFTSLADRAERPETAASPANGGARLDRGVRPATPARTS